MFGEEVSEVSNPIQRVGISTVLQKVFGIMATGLVVTAVTAFVVANSLTLLTFFLSTYLLWIIAELAIVLILSLRIQKMGMAAASITFYVYSIINGINMAYIFIMYTETSIASTFLITAVMFGAAAFYGKTTKRDLSKMGGFLFMALIGIIVAGIINIFIMNDMLSFIISVVGIFIFIAFTAYDVKKIERFSEQVDENDAEGVHRVAVIGALQLYLDFINIFLKLLSLTGKRRR